MKISPQRSRLLLELTSPFFRYAELEANLEAVRASPAIPATVFPSSTYERGRITPIMAELSQPLRLGP